MSIKLAGIELPHTRILCATISLASISSCVAFAQTAPAPAPSAVVDSPPTNSGSDVSFDLAKDRLNQRSDALRASEAIARAAQEDAKALDALRRPVINLDIQGITYQKSFNLQLDGVKAAAQNRIGSALDGFSLPAGSLPGGPGQDVIDEVVGRVRAAVPGVFNDIPSTLTTSFRQTLIRPTATTVIPLYTGGAIPALQLAGRARAQAAEAEAQSTRELLVLQLVEAYFGQVLAEQLWAVSLADREALDRHLSDVLALERQGTVSHSVVLEMRAARDAAQARLDHALGQLQVTKLALAGLLNETNEIRPSTPLFVNTGNIEPLTVFIDAAVASHSSLRKADAAYLEAQQGVRLAKARRRPSVYAFGEYNFGRGGELPIEPDWVIGIGIRYTLTSNVDRSRTASAAREREFAAEAAISDSNAFRGRHNRLEEATSCPCSHPHLQRSTTRSTVIAALRSCFVTELGRTPPLGGNKYLNFLSISAA